MPTDSSQSRISPVNTMPHGGLMGSLQQKRRGFELSAEPSIPPVNTMPHGGQMGSLQQKRRGLELSAEPSIPPVNTMPHGGQMGSLQQKRQGLELSMEPSIPYSTSQHNTTWSDGQLATDEAGLRAQCRIFYSTSQHSATWWSSWKVVRKEVGLKSSVRNLLLQQSTQCHREVRWAACNKRGRA